MTLPWIYAVALVAGASSPDLSTPPDLAATYKEVRDKAGRSSGEQVRLALWCEAHGLTAERLHHLTLAVLADPKDAAARGLMGLVSHEGRWLRPEAVAEKAKLDPTLIEYESRRQKAPYTADAQWALGLWADEHDLPQQARAHLTAVIRLDPSRDAAWKKLGYRRFDGRWKTDAQVLAEKLEAEAQERADRRWGPLLTKWRGWLDSAEKRPEAESGLDGLADPRAVGSVMKVFGNGGPGSQALAVRLLGQVDSPGSSRALTFLATWGKSAEVRRASAEILAHRDPREFLGPLIGGFRRTIRYELGTSPNAAGASIPYLAIEGKNYDFVLNSTRPVSFPGLAPRLFNDSVPFNPYGGPANPGYDGFGPSPDGYDGYGALAFTPAGLLIQQATEAARVRDAQNAQALARGPLLPPNFSAQASSLIAQIDAYNASAVEGNAAVQASLGLITGQPLPMDPDAWKKWWVDSLGYSFQAQAASTNQTVTSKPVYGYTVVSCFAAGTTVRTLTGDRAIETLKVGDQVLAQDTATGSLRYRSIAGVHHNPPAMALRVGLRDDVILATGFHRFWKVGQGWAMARELKAGDTIRTLEGPSRITSIEPDKVQPVFNLDVADDADFFVGKLGALVHDNTLPGPRAVPFDAGVAASK